MSRSPRLTVFKTRYNSKCLLWIDILERISLPELTLFWLFYTRVILVTNHHVTIDGRWLTRICFHFEFTLVKSREKTWNLNFSRSNLNKIPKFIVLPDMRTLKWAKDRWRHGFNAKETKLIWVLVTIASRLYNNIHTHIHTCIHNLYLYSIILKAIKTCEVVCLRIKLT